jgi:cytochrome P450
MFEAEEHGSERYGVLADRDVVDQALVLLLAGHETTATTLACALVELARNDAWQDRLRSALWEAMPSGTVTAEAVAGVPLVSDVVKEILRLYPPAPNISRLSVRDSSVDGYAVPAGATLVTSPWAMHRDPALWPEPARFDPGRWSGRERAEGDEHVPERTGEDPGGRTAHQTAQHAWLPFGDGPHACIGAQLALLEATLVLSVLVMNYRFTTTIQKIPLDAGITMRPAAPLPVRIDSIASPAKAPSAADA